MGSSNSGTCSDVIAAQGFPRRRARGASHAHKRATPWKTLAPQFITYQTRISVQSNGASSIFKPPVLMHFQDAVDIAYASAFRSHCFSE